VPAVLYRFRSEARRRWRAWLAVALLIGVVAGTVFALAAGARRTRSAQARFDSSQRAYDAAVDTLCIPPGTGDAERSGTPVDSCHDELARLPSVAAATTVQEFQGIVSLPDGTSVQPDPNDDCYSDTGAVSIVHDPSGRLGSEINRYRLVDGRLPNPAAVDEVLLSYETAHRLHLGVGDTLRVTVGTVGCFGSSSELEPPTQEVRIVGIQISPGEVRSPNGFFLQTLRVTPAFAATVGEVANDMPKHLMVRLRPGQTAADFERDALDAGYAAEAALQRVESEAELTLAIRPIYVSFALLALAMAIAAALVLTQVLFRQHALEADDEPLLGALGMSRRSLLRLAALRGVVVGVVAAAIGVVLAVVLSPLFPTGVAAHVEPDPGIAIDGRTLGLGFVVTTAYVAIVTVAAAAFVAWRRARADRPSPATLAGAAARAGMSPAAVSGFDLAFTRRAGSDGVPVASTLLALVIAVAALVGSATFGASLSELRSSPELVGWNWDALLVYPDRDEYPADLPDRVRPVLAADPNVESFAMIGIYVGFPLELEVAGRRVDPGGTIAFEGGSAISFPVVRGRAPVTADEMLVGRETLDDLGVDVGATVLVVGRSVYENENGGEDKVGPEVARPMRIVGTGPVAGAQKLGLGVALTLDGMRRIVPEYREQAWAVRWKPGTDPRQVFASFRTVFPDDPIEAFAVVTFADVPNRTAQLDEVARMPWLFAALMGVLAAAVLAHGLTSTTRARRRDIAVLRALGFSRGQTVRAVGWQANVYAVIALALGTPIGVLAGRSIWEYYATNFGAVPRAVLPWLPWLVMGGATLVLVAAIAGPTAWRVARVRPATVLRDE
jgi:hypothetical protein